MFSSLPRLTIRPRYSCSEVIQTSDKLRNSFIEGKLLVRCRVRVSASVVAPIHCTSSSRLARSRNIFNKNTQKLIHFAYAAPVKIGAEGRAAASQKSIARIAHSFHCTRCCFCFVYLFNLIFFFSLPHAERNMITILRRLQFSPTPFAALRTSNFLLIDDVDARGCVKRSHRLIPGSGKHWLLFLINSRVTTHESTFIFFSEDAWERVPSDIKCT